MKKCQFCGNEILDVAKKCKHCGKWLINEEAKIEQVEKTVKEPEQTTNQIQSKKSTKNCPYCCKEISAEAKKCPYCSEWVVKEEKDGDPTGCLGCFSVIIVAFIVIIACIWGEFSNDTDSAIGLIIVLFLIAVFYFLPTHIAKESNHPHTLAIFALNLLLGYTVIGWIVALLWSLIKNDK